MTHPAQRIAASLALAALLLCLHWPTLRALTVDSPLLTRADAAAAERLEESLTRALTIFAAARGLNAVISLFQGTELDLSPAGLGVTVAVGEVLDPVNDLVERFSWVMLAASASLGAQRLMVGLGPWLGLGIILSLAALSLLAGLWAPGALGARLRRAGWLLAAAAVVVRFFVPLSVAASEAVFERFLSPAYAASAGQIEDLRREFEGQARELGSGEEAGEEKGLLGLLADAASPARLKSIIGRLKDSVTRFTRSVVDLIVVFSLETILMPLAMLWLGLKVLGRLTGRMFERPFERPFKHPGDQPWRSATSARSP